MTYHPLHHHQGDIMLKKTLIALALACGLTVIASVIFKTVFDND